MLLLDEPLGALDKKLRDHMKIELKRLQREVGITTIYVTHDQEEALTMSDRIAVMHRGRVEQVAAPRGLYETPATAFVAELHRQHQPALRPRRRREHGGLRRRHARGHRRGAAPAPPSRSRCARSGSGSTPPGRSTPCSR